MRTNDGRIAPGMRLSPSTEFKPGQHWRKPTPFRDEEWLKKNYVDLQRSAGEIATDFGVTDAAVIFWLKKHGIPRRTIAEARAIKHWGLTGSENPMHGKFGPLNHNYVDGSSPERSRMYARSEGKEFLRTALRIGGYKCAKCEAGQAKANPLQVHHLKAWAGNPSLRFDLSNVAVLCRKCHLFVHSKKNINREFIHE
jgi:hypothetical protein